MDMKGFLGALSCLILVAGSSSAQEGAWIESIRAAKIAVVEAAARIAPLPGDAVPAPPEAAVRRMSANLYSLYVGRRSELVRMHRYAAKTRKSPAAWDIAQLVKIMDVDVAMLSKYRASSPYLPGALDDVREVLYTAQRATSSAIKASEAEDKVGVTAPHGDPMATLHRGELPEPGARLVEFRKAYEVSF
jgi:hypothetical protein